VKKPVSKFAFQMQLAALRCGAQEAKTIAALARCFPGLECDVRLSAVRDGTLHHVWGFLLVEGSNTSL
jgi:hypothetical protein